MLQLPPMVSWPSMIQLPAMMELLWIIELPFMIQLPSMVQLPLCRNKGSICIPNSTTEVWTVVDLDLLIDISIQLDQHVSSNDTLHQDLAFMIQLPSTRHLYDTVASNDKVTFY